MMKKLIAFVLVGSLLMSVTPAFATSSKDAKTKTTLSMTRQEAEKRTLKGVQWVDPTSQKTVSSKIAIGYWTCTTLDTDYLYEQFVKYKTSQWAYASQYTTVSSTTVNFGISPSVTGELKNALKVQLGLTASVSLASQTGICIPADPSHKSKLGLFMDYDYYFVQSDYYPPPYTSSTKTSYNDVYDPVPGSDTLMVVYY